MAMATRTCPKCEAQYVATVRRCIDCDVMLVDEKRPVDAPEPAPSAAAPVGAGEQVGYELDGWGNQLKVTLDGMLLRAGIGRVWEAGALVVAADDEAEVDDLIATLEGDDLPELDDDTPRVALEIEGLDVDGVAELDARLIADAVAHAWDDEGALVVAEADEDQVLEIIGDIFDAEKDDDGDDGLVAQQALSAVYVAVDRLLKNPHDRKLATTYVEAAGGLDGLPVPYGFAAADWDDLIAEARELADAVGPHAAPVVSDDDDDDEGEGDDEDGDVEELEVDAAADVPDTPDDPDPDPDPVEGDEPVEDESQSDHAEDPADDEDQQSEDSDDADPDDETDAVEIDRDQARALRNRLADLV